MPEPISERRAALVSERDFLLASIDDLDAELASGDIDPDDHATLVEDYTARTAAILHQLADLDQPASPEKSDGATAAGGHRRLAWIGGLAVVAVVAGWFLAQAAGERGTQDQLTGSVSGSLREKVFECQQIGTDPSRLTESLTCFDEVLAEDPNHVEALTYRGWYVVLAAGSAQQAGEDELAGELVSVGLDYIDRAIEVDPSASEAHAFRAVIRDRGGDADGACADVDALGDDTSPMILQLVGPLADRLGCPLD